MSAKGKQSNQLHAPEIFAKSIAGRWRSAALRAAPGMIVLSPYLTSKTAESVLAAGKECEVHTLFEVDQFASGASSIKTLKRLAEKGHKLFHLPDLHAKAFVDPASFASIGSQNLTNAGTKRKELSVAFSDSVLPRHVWDLIQPWLRDRVLISPEMIAEMEVSIGPAAKAFKVAKAAAQKAQKEYELRVKGHLAEGRKKERQLKLRSLRSALAEKVKSKETILATVKERVRRDGPDVVYMRTLKPERGRRFTDWTIDGEVTKLIWLRRYLCVMEDDGRIGWARVADYRITLINTDMRSPNDQIAVDGEKYSLGFEGVLPDENDTNLLIRLYTDDGLIVCTIDAWFHPGSLTIQDTTWTRNFSTSADHKAKVQEWIHSDRFGRKVMQLMTEPFSYERSLSGEQADRFFGPVGTKVKLRVVAEHGWPVLVGNRSED